MRHHYGRKKLNLKAPHRRSLLRNQVIHLITYGHLITTKANAKEVKKLAEKIVTIARAGHTFSTHRRVQALLPYKKEAILKLFKEIAPGYADRPGGYTRLISLGQRVSDTAPIAKLEWV
jgi:large subunit ribosomal protein L17